MQENSVFVALNAVDCSIRFTMRKYNNIERPDYTPNFITALKPDEVFVFGSNLEGMHGGGIAGFQDREIAPLFAEARETQNICLPRAFVVELEHR